MLARAARRWDALSTDQFTRPCDVTGVSIYNQLRDLWFRGAIVAQIILADETNRALGMISLLESMEERL
jgi:MoxR-like ATPase